MNAAAHFRALMAERRHFPRGSAEWSWRTRAARKFAWIMRKTPTAIWTE
jgi:hypothetical protein